ncbi:triose-phosphate isomerase, partial [bacterium]|nr:triose-phosphate isomerase [candidate division CSSED10-310 bacterium]
MRVLIVGNWKMHMPPRAAVTLTKHIISLIRERAVGEGVETVICPPFVSLGAVAECLDGVAVSLGAQNMFWEVSGAFTGEISPEMLVEMGCRYVILGHSERRQIFQELDAWISRKVIAALAAGLNPIVCVGETENERDDGETFGVVERQLRGSLAGVDSSLAAHLVIAYEPVWAIGTGRTATPDQAREVHAAIRSFLKDLFPSCFRNMPILYGGSVKPDNV